jgi:GTPase involved in cell partitioning and DNA repair
MVNVAHGENIKPTQKSGSSNPYVYIKVPEGTVVPPPEQPLQRKKAKTEEPEPEPKPTILNGSACEILR